MGRDFLSDFSINNFPEGLMNVRACSFFNFWSMTCYSVRLFAAEIYFRNDIIA